MNETTNDRSAPWQTAIALLACLAMSGCSLFPDRHTAERLHNPFPQMHIIAVLPFFNQSENPTVDGQAAAAAYFAAVQNVPGFEVLPIGVTTRGLEEFIRRYGEPTSGEQFQTLAKFLGVDAVVVGSVTDFDAFYPPRMAMSTRWYAANEGFHPIPAGYGLPWGTDAEEHIPPRVVREAEFELARAQLATQSPIATGSPAKNAPTAPVQTPARDREFPVQPLDFSGESLSMGPAGASVPTDWPDPTGFVPDPPSAVAPVVTPSHDPVLSHTRLYRGDDSYFTGRLADYVETADDARPSGWQGYLRRSDDFVRFCCHLHVTEMLESRGGRGQSDLIVTWPHSRY